MRLCALLAALVVFAPTVPRADATAGDFELFELRFPEPARSHRVADVDGDGRLDMSWVFTSDEAGEDYWLRSCLFGSAQDTSQAHFSRCSDLDLPPNVRGYDIGELDGQPGAELVLITRDGGALASFRDGGFGALEPTPLESLFSATDDDAPLALELLFDLAGDGTSEILVPTLRGPALIRATGRGLSAPLVLESPARVRYGLDRPGHELGIAADRGVVRPITTRATAAPVQIDDFDGDGRLDITTSVDHVLRVFLQAHDGSFAPEPTHRIERSVITPSEKDAGFSGEALSFADLDGDGTADLIALKWGSSEERTRMDRHLFFARPGVRYPEKADQILRSESFFPQYEIRDLNGDGRLDLLIPYFHIAPAQAFKVMTQNALRVQLRLFLMRDDGRYAQGEGKRFAKVDRRVVLDYQLNVIRLIFGSRTPPEAFAPLLTTLGDFDGDGFPDLASDSGDDRLHLRFGNERAEYSTWPDLALPFESSLSYELVDLNGDGRSDLVAYYGASRGKRNTSQRAPGELRRGSRPKPRPAEPDEADEAESRIGVLLSR